MRTYICLFMVNVSLRRSAYFFLRFSERPLSGLVGEVDARPVCFLPRLSRLASAHCCFFTRFISTPCIFGVVGLSAVSDLDNRLRYLLRSWGSFYFCCPTFSRGGSEVVGKFSDHASGVF